MTNQTKTKYEGNQNEKMIRLMEKVFQTRAKNFELYDFHFNTDTHYYYGRIYFKIGIIFDDEITQLHIQHIGICSGKVECEIVISKEDFDILE